MAWGLPKLPGLTFSDPTKTQFHMKSSLRYYQGHRFPDTHLRGPGATDTDVDSNAFALPDDSVKYVKFFDEIWREIWLCLNLRIFT